MVYVNQTQTLKFDVFKAFCITYWRGPRIQKKNLKQIRHLFNTTGKSFDLHLFLRSTFANLLEMYALWIEIHFFYYLYILIIM